MFYFKNGNDVRVAKLPTTTPSKNSRHYQLCFLGKTYFYLHKWTYDKNKITQSKTRDYTKF